MPMLANLDGELWKRHSTDQSNQHRGRTTERVDHSEAQTSQIKRQPDHAEGYNRGESAHRNDAPQHLRRFVLIQPL